MKKIKLSLVESLGPFFIGLMSTAEGARIITKRSQHDVYQALGPGGYILIIGLALMVCSVIYGYTVITRAQTTVNNKTATNRELRGQMIKIVISMIGYIGLIEILGFALATGCFFVMMFKFFKFPWRQNIIFSIAFSLPLYVIFVYWLNIPFPKGFIDINF